MLDALGALLLTYLLHASVLLGLVAALDRAGWLARWGAAEAAWRAAMLGAWITALTAQWGGDVTADVRAPLAMPTAVTATPAEVSTPAPAATLALPVVRPTQTQMGNAPATKAWPRLGGALALLGVVVWALGAVGACARLGWQALHLRQATRRLPAWHDQALLAQAQRWALQKGRPVPNLRLTPLASPWAWSTGWGRGTVGLPAWVATDLDASQQRTVLAHELAHLARFDPGWRALCLVVATLGWVHPLNRLALRRLDALMEQACDQAAAPDPAARHALARSLMRCAEHVHGAPMPGLLPAMAAAESQALLTRMRHLLEPKTMPKLSIRRARWWLAGGLLLAAATLPAAMLPRGASLTDLVPNGALDLADDIAHGVGSGTVVRTGGPGLRQSLRWRGQIQFNEAEDDVLSVDGPLHFRETRGGTVREWLVTPLPNGLQRSYRVNGVEQTQPDAQGRAWIQAMVRIAIEATVPAPVRARRHWERGGADALLAYVNGSLDAHQRRTRIEAAVQAMPASQRPADLVDRLLAASRHISHPFDHRHALAAIAQHGGLTSAQWPALLQQVPAMGSDFERASLLAELAPALPDGADVQAAWRRAAGAIDGDFEQRRALEVQLARGRGDWRATVLQVATNGLQSDFEHSSLLKTLAQQLHTETDGALTAAAALSTQRIGSAFERRQALVALAAHKPVDTEALDALLRASAGVQSSFERLAVLRALAPLVPDEGPLRKALRAQAQSLDQPGRDAALAW